ncbi:MAG: hypothetical protein JWN70_2996 [Planctomycetaceae bacterium]|nr:hypothetical protein [Planctomycetaceae bacterium]
MSTNDTDPTPSYQGKILTAYREILEQISQARDPQAESLFRGVASRLECEWNAATGIDNLREAAAIGD